MRAVKAGHTVQVISPTHKTGAEVTAAIRKKLRQVGRIGKKEIAATRMINLNYTEAEKSDWQRFTPGQVVQFNQNQTGFQRGSQWAVKTAENGLVHVQDAVGKEVVLPLSSARHFNVFHKTEMPLSKGDTVHVTHGAFDEEGKRLNNGTTLEVLSIARKGTIVLHNPASKARYVLRDDFGHIAHAHTITSPASQSKTVDKVFVAQPSSTFAASNAKQFYVSVSRGRYAVHIYTDDKKALLEQVSLIGNRTSALELVGETEAMKYIIQAERNVYNKTPVPPLPVKELILQPSITRDYEPEL